MRLRDKVAIVTGSSRGIGRAIAVRLAKEGCKVVINYHEDLKAAEETKELCGKDSFAIKADVSKVSECKDLVDETIKKFGKVDILVNNAGIVIRKQLQDFTEKDWDITIDTNLKGPFFLIQYASKHMQNGSIINISAARIVKHRATTATYAASKAGLASLTQGLALELADKKIRINAVAPGPTRSGQYETLPEALVKQVVEAVPLKRLGEPEEIANVVAFLASDEASFVNGSVILVDGGYHVG
ncbi:MAG: 3-oxoacyl-ACP reductase FabG [Candidatus Aenigmarchaeota archaeon]|nr:3-oxoacyl-ACP reductase FabG [Candidatus Aenigmarchaeota archaeon]